MSTGTPSPTASHSAVSPVSISNPPPPPTQAPPPPDLPAPSPSSHPTAILPSASPTVSNSTAPSPTTLSPPPPVAPAVAPPPPPVGVSPPLAPKASPPPPPSRAISPSPPPPSKNPPPPPLSPISLPPPPDNPPPTSSTVNPPPPSLRPPPPPPSDPPKISPPSPPSDPPTTSSPPPPPPLAPNPSKKSPPPPAGNPPVSPPSPPPPATPPADSPSPPSNSPPPPTSIPPAPGSQPSPSPPNSPPKSSPPPPVIKLTPPPSSLVLSPPPATQNTSNPNGNGGNNAGLIAGVGVAVGLILLSLFGLVFWCRLKRKNKASGLDSGYVMPSPLNSSAGSESYFLKGSSSTLHIESGFGSGFASSPTEHGGFGHSRSLFSYEALEAATNGFSIQNLLGEGGFGSVYKGYLPDGREVAVKQLKIGGGQGEREFRAEVEIIGRIHHRHLVSLVGYCIADSRRLLVYDYVTNNSLYFHLHEKGQPVMDWATRVKVAIGAARGITYLHEDCHPRIIHRDIKSSNILLDDNFEARVSDFGLAKLALDADTHITTRVMGTFGYLAPEYASSGKLTEKSDVYSFGVVLLELITGRKSVDAFQPLGDESLVEWARPLLSYALDSEEFDSLVDSRLEKNYVDSEMFRMIEAAAACVRHSAAKRPRMRQVVRAFDSMVASDLNNGMRVGDSAVFNSAEQSAEIRLFRRMAFGSQNYSTDYFTQDSLNTTRSKG